jgi:hypothetical protein
MSMKQWMTFGIKTEGADKAAKDIDKVADASKKAEESQEGLNDSIESGTGALDNMTGGAITAFSGVVSGVKKAVLGMKTLKGAIMATGIGALVVIVASLVSYFTQTKKGAEVLQVATAALGAVFGVISDVLSSIGEAMVWAFQNPQEALEFMNRKLNELSDWFTSIGNYIKEGFNLNMLALQKNFKKAAIAVKEFFGSDATELRAELLEINKQIVDTQAELQKHSDAITEPLVKAWENVKEGVTNFVKEVVTAVNAASALEKRAIKLADAQRNLSVEFAQQRQKIQELNKVADDTTLSIEERIAATEEAAEIEQGLADKRLRQAQEAVAIQREQNALSESTAEDLQALADLEIALSEAQIETLGVQTGLMAKVNGLYAEQDAKILETQALEEDRLAGMIERQSQIDAVIENEKTLEILAIQDKYRQMRLLAKLNGQTLADDKKAEKIELDAIDAKYAQQELDRARAVHESKTQFATNALGALMALNTAFAKDDEESQRKAFERNKALGLVSAIVNTASAVIGAISPAAGGLGIPAGIPGALMAAASGAAQIATISKTTFGDSTTDDVEGLREGTDSGGLGAQAASSAPQIDLGFLGQGSGSTMQAYVISEQVNNQLQADQIVTDQTTL